MQVEEHGPLLGKGSFYKVYDGPAPDTVLKITREYITQCILEARLFRVNSLDTPRLLELELGGGELRVVVEKLTPLPAQLSDVEVFLFIQWAVSQVIDAWKLGFVITDLSVDNVMFDKDRNFVLSDLNCVHLTHLKGVHYSWEITKCHLRAPERKESGVRLMGPEGDLWSIGIIALGLLSGDDMATFSKTDDDIQNSALCLLETCTYDDIENYDRLIDAIFVLLSEQPQRRWDVTQFIDTDPDLRSGPCALYPIAVPPHPPAWTQPGHWTALFTYLMAATELDDYTIYSSHNTNPTDRELDFQVCTTFSALVLFVEAMLHYESQYTEPADWYRVALACARIITERCTLTPLMEDVLLGVVMDPKRLGQKYRIAYRQTNGLNVLYSALAYIPGLTAREDNIPETTGKLPRRLEVIPLPEYECDKTRAIRRYYASYMEGVH